MIKYTRYCRVLFLFFFLFSGFPLFAENPIVQTNYTADPAPMVYNDTFWIYSGHDEDGSTVWFNMKEWRCYSSVDMANWTDHGSPLDLSAFSSWANADAWAGQVIPYKGKFYFYVPVFHSGTKNRMIGVAVADKPTGPFKDALGKPMQSRYDCCYIDPTVYVDDDDQAYMYWGNPYCFYVKLNKDMTSFSGDIVQIPENAQTFSSCYGEAPWLYKKNSQYYLLWAADNANGKENIRYSTSTSPTGPWKYSGVIMPTQGLTWNQPCTSWTNHEGIVDFKGKSYFVYHNAAAPGGGAFMRSTCIEEFKYNADGTIPQINMTLAGPAQIGHLDPYDTTQAETICWASGLKTEKCSEGGMNVCKIENGDYIKVKGVDFGTAGATKFEARVASASNGGSIEIYLDTMTNSPVGTCTITGTGGAQIWTTKSCVVTDVKGVHNLFFKFKGGSGNLFTFNWWKFTSSVGAHPGLRKAETLINVNLAVKDNRYIRLNLNLPHNGHNNVKVHLFDISGKLIDVLYDNNVQYSKLSTQFDLHAAGSGTYLARVFVNNRTILTKRLHL
jgi:arabinoxylan arabinofuranohydrolase